MKFLVFSDLHIHNYSKFDDNGSRLQNCLNVIKDMYKYASEHNIKHIVFPGDLYDQQKALPSIVINETIKTFMKMEHMYRGIEFIAISGNHDHASKNTLECEAVTAIRHLADVLEYFYVLDNMGRCLGEDIWISGIPYYTHAAHFTERLINPAPTDEKSYLMIHQTPQHSNPMIAHECKYEDFNAWDFVFCGHIHKYERLSKNFVIVGSPLHRDYGDEGQDKGFLVFDTNTNDYERVLLDYPKFVRGNEAVIKAEDPGNTDFITPIVEQDKEVDIVIDINSKHEDQLKQYCDSLELSEDIYQVGLSMLN